MGFPVKKNPNPKPLTLFAEMIVHIDREYTVRRIHFWRIIVSILAMFFVCFYFLPSDKSNLSIAFNVIIPFVTSFLIERFSEKQRTIYSEEILGDVLASTRESNSKLLQQYQTAIRARLNKTSIILRSEKNQVINDLILLLNVYHSCYPFSRDEFPASHETYTLFEAAEKSSKSIFQDYDLNLNALKYIYYINLKFRESNFDLIRYSSENWDLNPELVCPELRELVHYSETPLNKIADTKVMEVMTTTSSIRILLSARPSVEHEKVYRLLIDLTSIIDDLGNYRKYGALQLVALTRFLGILDTLIAKNRETSYCNFSSKQISRLKEIRERFRSIKLTPFYHLICESIINTNWTNQLLLEFLGIDENKNLPIKQVIAINTISSHVTNKKPRAFEEAIQISAYLFYQNQEDEYLNLLFNYFKIISNFLSGNFDKDQLAAVIDQTEKFNDNNTNPSQVVTGTQLLINITNFPIRDSRVFTNNSEKEQLNSPLTIKSFPTVKLELGTMLFEIAHTNCVKKSDFSSFILVASNQ